ncbi:MAG: anhydro-N-acetylmuramic acid kinase [Chloroflexi bacterium]|nr:anhydro-N-acetylmuramic acid kinase [Chloroflexota bacterium]
MSQLAIGIMSGTSTDGINVALVEADWGDRPHPRVSLVEHRAFSYPDALRERVFAAVTGAPTTAWELARLHAALGDAYAEAAAALVTTAAHPQVIGLHGQTVAHFPAEDVTLQVGDPARVALRTGIPTVADFRSADIAAGGEGAPLTPFADHVLFSDGAPRIVLNLGGIANVTLLPDPDADHVTGWDTGPANMVVDAIARMSGARFDEGGAGARRGRVVPEALERALAHPFFARPAPKSTGREEFGEDFAVRLVGDVRSQRGSLDDALATAAALTGTTVGAAIREAPAPPAGWREVLVGGGGSANAALMSAIASALSPIPVRLTDELGIPAAAREAIAFAILALYRIRGLPNTLPRVTGARRAVSAGAVHQP